MSHLASRLVAAFLADATNGLDVIAANVPRVGADAAPDPVTVYSEWDTDWLAQGKLPSEASDPDIAYPCALVVTGQSRFEDGGGMEQAGTASRFTSGTVSVVVQLIVRDTDSAAGLRQLGYLLRATRNALMALSLPANIAHRTDDTLGVRLYPATGSEWGRSKVPMGDDALSVALVTTFPVHEFTLLSLS